MRNVYDLSHLSHIAGDIGRIQTMSIIPVEAGASLELDMDGLVRLAPNRKEIVSDCQVDICAFFVPHRIIYGSEWINLINAGPDSSITFTGIAVASGARDPAYLCLPTCGATINRALVEGYNRIFYNYFAVPSYPRNGDNGLLNNDFTWYPDTSSDSDVRCRKYGRLAARLPHVLNGGNAVEGYAISGGNDAWLPNDLQANDAEVPVNTGAGIFSILDLAKVQSRYKSEAQSAWFAHFYQDVYYEKWGTKIGPDADPDNLRPHMLMRSTSMISGHDIDGTDDATLGTFQGKSMDRVRFHMPRKLFPEHGFVWVMALLRYPLVHNREQHPLLAAVTWDYDTITADPTRYSALPPVMWNPGNWLAGGSNVTPNDQVKEPYGQHYRFQPNRVHPNFLTIPGYPFSNWNGTLPTEWYYYLNNEYKDSFATTQIGQWQLHALLKTKKHSLIPGVSASIFAGT